MLNKSAVRLLQLRTIELLRMTFKLLRCILQPVNQLTWSQFDTSLYNLLGMVLVMIQCMLMLT